MGKTWTREGGTQEPQRPQRPHVPPFPAKRKANVWTRDAQQDAVANGSTAGEAGEREAKRRRLAAKGRLLPGQELPDAAAREPSTANGAREPAATPQTAQAARAAAAQAREAARKAALVQEAEALRRRIAEEEAKLAAAKAAAQKAEAQAAAALKAKQEQANLRKSRLDAGFAEAFRITRELAASQKAPRVSAAGEAEVRRVLAAKSDLDVLQLKAGADRAAVKKKYRSMTLALHPDKCKVDKATDAFQRLVVAYQGALKYAR